MGCQAIRIYGRDHPWLGGTTYGGAMDGLSKATIDDPAGSSMATKFAVDGPTGPVVGGPSVA